MHPPIPREASEAFAALAALVYDTADSTQILEAVCRAAVEIVPAVDHACVSTLVDGELRTRAATDEIARQMDRLESEAGEGPCLDSIVEESFQRDDDIATNSTWPALAELTLASTPVRGMVGYRLENGRSALNLFSDKAGALTAEAADMGAVLAAFASVALSAGSHRETAESLRRGLDSNREIGKAVGLLMAAHSISDEEAFDILRSASSRTNTRLAVVAERINANHRDQL